MNKLSELLKELKSIYDDFGDLDLSLQHSDLSWDEDIFAIPEEYEEGLVLNIRSWPH